MADEIVDQIKEIFMLDEDFETKFAFLSDGKQAKIIEGSVNGESQEALIQCLLTISEILSKQEINSDLRDAVESVLSLSHSSTGETIH